ncbi:unnamed protein product [Mortierella alpina]
MEIVDKQEVVLLDGLNPTALPPYTMIRTATVFESALQLHSSYSAGSPFTSLPVDAPPPADQSSHQQRFKNRLQKIIRIPPSVAQTHTRMTTIRLGISRVEKKKLASTGVTVVHSPSTTPTPTTPTTDKVAFVTSTPPSTTRASAQDGEEEASAPATPLPSPNALDTTERSHHLKTIDSVSSNTDSDEPDPMASREGFAVSNSLFAKVKARVLSNQRSHQRQQQRHPLVKTRSTGDSGNSQLDDDDAEQRKRSSRDRVEIEVESNSSDSNTNTLSAGTSGNLNKGLHLSNSLHHHHDIDAHNDPSNDSDSTVTEIEESAARRQQRKYDFERARSDNSTSTQTGAFVAPALVTAAAAAPATAVHVCGPVLSHAEVIAEEQNEGFVLVTAPTDANADDNKGEDPVQLFEQVLHRQHMTEEAIAGSLHELRQLILAYGIPDEPSTPGSKSTRPSIRSRCWKLLLEVHHISAQEYVSLVKQGKPEEYGKIRNDTFRTLATDRKFLDVVVEESLIRVLCAFAWSTQGKDTETRVGCMLNWTVLCD